MPPFRARIRGMQGAAKVGFLVIAFVALVYGAYTFLGRSLLRPPTTDIYARFADAGGLTEGTKVLLAGVKIGQVKKVSLASPRLAVVTMEIDSSQHIPVGSTAVLPTSFISFGDSPVNIVPPAKITPHNLQAGDTIEGIRPGPLDGVFPNSKETLGELTKTLAATRKL